MSIKSFTQFNESYTQVEMSNQDLTEIKQILNLAEDEGLKIVINGKHYYGPNQIDDYDRDLHNCSRIDFINIDDVLSKTEFYNVFANIYHRLVDVGPFKGYREFTAKVRDDEDDGMGEEWDYDEDDYDDEYDDYIENGEDWEEADPPLDYQQPIISEFMAVSIFRKIRQKGMFEKIENYFVDQEDRAEIRKILDIASDEGIVVEDEFNTYPSYDIKFINHEQLDNKKFLFIINQINDRLEATNAFTEGRIGYKKRIGNAHSSRKISEVSKIDNKRHIIKYFVIQRHFANIDKRKELRKDL